MVTPTRPSGTDSSTLRVPVSLVLVRTQPGQNFHEGFAAIGVNRDSPQTYCVGAALANGARLSEIHSTFVVLERDGHQARLNLLVATRPDVTGLSDLLTVGGAQPVLDRTPRSDDRVTTILRPSPVFAGERLRGYAVYPGRNSTPFFDLGLQPGDVLTKVNGTSVSDSSNSLSDLEGLSSGAAVTVEVMRRGRLQTLTLDGSALHSDLVTTRPPGIRTIGDIFHRSASYLSNSSDASP